MAICPHEMLAYSTALDSMKRRQLHTADTPRNLWHLSELPPSRHEQSGLISRELSNTLTPQRNVACKQSVRGEKSMLQSDYPDCHTGTSKWLCFRSAQESAPI